MKSIGVLALQGDFDLHLKMVRKAGGGPVEVRTVADLDQVDALIIPGGESTTVAKLLRRYGLDRAITRRYKTGSLALYGTCMGLILVSREIVGYPDIFRFGFLDIAVERNAYGPQVESFEEELPISLANGDGKSFSFRAVFIRAPQITEVGDGVKTLASHAGRPVLVSQGRCLGGSFHPELTDDCRVHEFFIEQFVGGSAKNK
ncbi:MAG: pyridoxal 5'-phosphate synthase glutaminase subunit PdxT [bacterium]